MSENNVFQHFLPFAPIFLSPIPTSRLVNTIILEFISSHAEDFKLRRFFIVQLVLHATGSVDF